MTDTRKATTDVHVHSLEQAIRLLGPELGTFYWSNAVSLTDTEPGLCYIFHNEEKPMTNRKKRAPGRSVKKMRAERVAVKDRESNLIGYAMQNADANETTQVSVSPAGLEAKIDELQEAERRMRVSFHVAAFLAGAGAGWLIASLIL